MLLCLKAPQSPVQAQSILPDSEDFLNQSPALRGHHDDTWLDQLVDPYPNFTYQNRACGGVRVANYVTNLSILPLSFLCCSDMNECLKLLDLIQLEVFTHSL